MAVSRLLLVIALALGCSASKKDAVPTTITFADASPDWTAAMTVAADALQAAWAKKPAARLHLAPAGALKYRVAVGFSRAETGPLGRTEVFVLDGRVVERWTPALRVAALRQIGLPAHRPAPVELARFLDGMGLFDRPDFPGVWLDGQLRSGVTVTDAGSATSATLHVDYPVARAGGGGGGAPGDATHRLTVRFDGRAISVTHAVIRP